MSQTVNMNTIAFGCAQGIEKLLSKCFKVTNFSKVTVTIDFKVIYQLDKLLWKLSGALKSQGFHDNNNSDIIWNLFGNIYLVSITKLMDFKKLLQFS